MPKQTNSPPSPSQRWGRWLTGALVALLLLAAGCQASVDVTGGPIEGEIITRSNDGLEVRPESDFEEEAQEEEAEEEEADVAEGVEIAECVVEVNDSGTFASVPVTNGTTEPVSVFLRVSVTDGDGTEVATEPVTATELRPGFTAQERTQVWSPAGEAVVGAVACNVFESRSNPPSDLIRGAGDDLPPGTFTCRVTGLDVVGDVKLEFDISNPFDEPRNMQALVAVLNEDGIRVGTALPTVRDVAIGESVGVPLSTWVPGFVEATSCEVIWSIS